MSVGAAHGIFVGREAELRLLRAKFDEVRAGEPRMVLVEGPPGIGKTALLRQFVAETGEVHVLRASAAQEESLLPFGVAEQLALSARVPLPDELASLGRRSERSPEPIAVGGALLELLGSLQRSGPVVMVLDDMQWADRPTLLALLFVLRRLQADRVLALVAGREEARTSLPEGLVRLFEDERGAALSLSGLDVTELQELGTAMTTKRLPMQLAQHIREHTGGSPLHARSVLEELPIERLGHAVEAPLPAPRSFGAQVLSRLATCRPESRQLVVAAAVLGLDCPLGLARRLAELDDPLPALEEATSARLLETRDADGERNVGFPHALVRAAVYHDLGPARRAALHRRAAGLVEDEAAVLQHRVAAASEQDETLAADLAGYARREASRGAWSRAATAMLASSRLTPAREQRELRLLEGVDSLVAGGEMPVALTYTDQVDAAGDGALQRYVRGRLALHSGRHSEGEELLSGAWTLCDPATDRELAVKIAMEICFVLMRRARGDQLVTWCRRALAAAEATPLARAPLGTLAYGLAYSGRAEEGLAELAFLDERPSITTLPDLFTVGGRGLLRAVTDDLVGARDDARIVEAGSARFGTLLSRLATLFVLSFTEYRLGTWDDAILHAELAASLAEDGEQVWVMTLTHYTPVPPLAGRGLWEAAERHADASVRLARVVDDENARADAAMAQAHIAAARGDPQAVVQGLQDIVAMPDRQGIDEPGTRWPWQELCADALVSLGRLDEAEAVLVPFEKLATDRRRRSALTNASRVRGNLEAARGQPDAAEAAYLAGLDHAERVPIPFDRARLEAAYGHFLRRQGRRRDAVAQLTAARDRLALLEARPYLERCERELAACGVARERTRDPDRSKLTPQELSVARLVASGMSNPKVAAELFVSINTVEFHLKNVYGKLGIRSREELRERMARS